MPTTQNIPSAKLPVAVKASIAAEADPNRPVIVLAATGVDTVIGFTYLRDARYLDDTVRSALHAALLDRDAWPLIRAELPGIGADFYRHARERLLIVEVDLTEDTIRATVFA